MAGSCKCGDERSGYIKCGEFLQYLRKGSSPLSHTYVSVIVRVSMSQVLRVTCSVNEDTVNGRMGNSDCGRMTANNYMSEDD